MKKPYELLNLTQGSPEWKAERLKHVTASNVPVLFDQSPYKTILQLFEEHVLGEEEEVSETKQILFNRGHDAEKVGREWAEKNLGFNFKPEVVLSLLVPNLLASLDGFDIAKNVIFEAKYMGKNNLENVKKGIIQPHHITQMQAQLLATGANYCVYFAMDGTESAMVKVFPDKVLFEEIPRAVAKFMKQVRDGIAPEPGDRDFHTPNDSRFLELAAHKRQMDLSKKQFEDLKEILAEDYKNFRRIKDGGLLMTKVITKGRIDYAVIPQLKGVDVERYRKGFTESVKVSIDKNAALKTVKETA